MSREAQRIRTNVQPSTIDFGQDTGEYTPTPCPSPTVPSSMVTSGSSGRKVPPPTITQTSSSPAISLEKVITYSEDDDVPRRHKRKLQKHVSFPTTQSDELTKRKVSFIGSMSEGSEDEDDYSPNDDKHSGVNKPIVSQRTIDIGDINRQVLVDLPQIQLIVTAEEEEEVVEEEENAIPSIVIDSEPSPPTSPQEDTWKDLEKKIQEYKKDPELVIKATCFVHEILTKAKEEAHKRIALQETPHRTPSPVIGPRRLKQFPWYGRFFGVFGRWVSKLFICGTSSSTN